MKAWRLDLPRRSFTWADVPEPEPRGGSVVVRVEAVSLVSYLRDYVGGKLDAYHPPAGAFTPGTSAVGIVERTGADVFTVQPGQRVLMTGYYTVAANVPEPPEALLGSTAGPGSAPILETWPDGTLAELAAAPLSTVTPVPAALDGVSSARLAAVSRCLVPYGGLLRGRLEPGETVVINGATGAYGTAGVHVALAMGAARVIAAGRDQQALARLDELERVRAVRLTGDVAADADALRAAAGGSVPCALDLVGGAATPDSTLAALAALGRRGRLVLMGSSPAPVPIDYTQLMLTQKEVIGNFMYPASAPARLLRLAAAGLLDLDRIPLVTRKLANLESAMDEAAQPAAPLVVVGP
jgi:alcohol dehydrogenase